MHVPKMSANTRIPDRRALLLVAGLFPIFCLVPPLSALFEATMSGHMLIQLPLLVACGVLIIACSDKVQKVFHHLDPSGYSCAVLFSGWLIFWMLPINLDAAQETMSFRMLKVFSLPLGIGVAGYWAWNRLPGIGRGVLILEVWAMFIRVGWIFLISPDQVCASYLPDEQRIVGRILLQVGFVMAVIVVAYVFFRPYPPDER